MELRAGDVVRIWDRSTTPEKLKLHICVCPEAQLFLRVNSREYWPPYHLLYAQDCPFLDHDSYVELQQLWHHVRSEIRGAEVIGSLPPEEARKLCLSVNAARTLSASNKRFVLERLLPFGDA